ncbi:MAG TPA: secretin N-terminal domain-containing protein [Candidatus Eisenbacteria bacterium]|nr:secretin N-terminal domain-containing protein [Candidatus Eisenbacteria bacterium]
MTALLRHVRKALSLILAAVWLAATTSAFAVPAPSGSPDAESDSSDSTAEAPADEAQGRSSAEAPSQEEAAPPPPAGAFSPLSGDDRVPADQQLVPTSLGIEEKVSLDLRSIEVSEALRFLALKGGLNMAISKTVTGRVQLLLNNVPIRDILDLILITNGLAYEKIGDVYYVMTEQEYKDRYGRKFSDARQVRIFKLQYAVPEQAFALFEVLKSEIGRLLVDPESGTVLVMDSAENIQRMETALRALEEKKSVKVYSLKYAKAVDVETRLKARLDNKKVGTVSADERTNSVIVETLPERMHEIDDVVAALDQKTREVLIEAKIVSVILNDQYNADISWEGLFSQLNTKGTAYLGNHGINPLFRAGTSFVDDFVQIPLTARPNQGAKNVLTENLVLGQVGEDPFEVLINFLKKYGETKVLSSPKLAVINNQEAKILVGDKQAYVTTTTTTGQTTTTTAESVTFIDVGIQLAVTPSINEDGFVTMKIKPQISNVTDFLTTPSGNRIPIVNTSQAETTVMVKDGVSILIGGLKRQTTIKNNSKIPFLGDVPILGRPFNSKNESVVHDELLILMTPHIVGGDTLVSGDSSQPAGKDLPLMPYADYDVSRAAPPADLRKTDAVASARVTQ